MKSRFLSHPSWFVGLATICLFCTTACNSSSRTYSPGDSADAAAASLAPAMRAYRDRYWLSEVPAEDVLTATDVRNRAADDAIELPPGAEPEESEEVAQDEEVVIAGRINAGELAAFEPDSASFVIVQLPDEGHAADDPEHADNCPFCKRELANAPMTLVRFCDEQGKTLPISAEKLFGLAAGDVVLVRGRAEYVEGPNMVNVTASGIYRKD